MVKKLYKSTRQGPGPKYVLPTTVGMKDHDPTIDRAPGYSFGGRYSYSNQAGPGPTYYIESGMSNRGRPNNAGFTLLGRPKKSMFEVAAESSPGPGYAPDYNATNKRVPAYSFGSPYKNNYKSEGPGPGTYAAQSTWGRNTKGAIIGSRSTGGKGNGYVAPGPGHYGNPYLNQTRGPCFTIGQRYKGPTSKFVTPGPIYNTRPGYMMTNPESPRFSMGVRHHDEVITMADVSD